MDNYFKKKTENALQNSMNYFDLAFHKTGTAILIVDENSRIIMADFLSDEKFGYSTADIIGKPYTQFVAPGHLDMIIENREMRKIDPENTPSQFEVKYIDKQGGERDALVTVSMLPKGKRIIFLLDITESKKAQRDMKNRDQIRNLLLNISENFNKVVAEEIDDMINLALKQIAEFNNDDRSYVVLLSEDGSTFENTHEWNREGIDCRENNIKDSNVDHFPWMMEKLENNENININKSSDFPPEAAPEREDALEQGVKSILVVPMIYENRLIGYLGFKSVTKEKNWKEDSIAILDVLGNIFANALQRKKYTKTLEQSESYYRTIFESTGAATLIVEEDETISNANREWERLFGYRKEELLGKKITDFVTEDFIEKIREYHTLRRVIPELVPKRYNMSLLNEAGKVRDCMVFADIIPGTSNSIVSFLDTTEFDRINRVLKSTSSVNMAMLHADNEEELLRQVCRNIVEIGGYRFVWVGYVDGTMSHPLRPVAYAGHEDSYIDVINKIWFNLGERIKPMHGAIATGKIFICKNIEADPVFLPWREESLKRGYRSMISIPLTLAGTSPLGAIGIYSDEIDVFDEEEVSHLVEMASDLTFGIQSLRTKKERDESALELKKSLDRMQQLFNQTVASLEAVVRIRDPYTAEHQRKVTKLAVAIAEEMELNDDMKKAIFITASLHDIGKMNIPSDILNKPGKITELEYSLIKSHCKTGYEVIKNIHFPWSIDEIILQHHERMDGSGYPQGLKGEDIHLPARIIGVADVVEAMSSHRPYRPALGVDKALEEITMQRGIKYDPDVVDACLNLFRNNGFEL
ncbi:MAG: HD domain-containing phosphohydrolase [Clostridiaceae bacterium]